MHFPLAEINATSASENAPAFFSFKGCACPFLVSKDVNVNETVKTLKNGERQLFELIGEMTKESLENGDAAGVTSGQVQAGVLRMS